MLCDFIRLYEIFSEDVLVEIERILVFVRNWDGVERGVMGIGLFFEMMNVFYNGLF